MLVVGVLQYSRPKFLHVFLGHIDVIVPMLRHILIIFAREFFDFGLHKTVNGATVCHALADNRAVEIIEGCVDEGDTRWKCGGIDGGIVTRIDDDGIVTEDFFVVFPAVEGEPVVGSHDQGEVVLGVSLGEFAERVVRIRGFGEAEFEVAGHETGLAFEGKLGEFQAQIVG